MRRQSVSSSNLRSLGYDQGTSTLEIEFHNSGTYRYFEVPVKVYTSLMSSASLGDYFHTHIKDVYPYAKVG